MSKPLANRVALVTGAARGIGAATAAALADAGAQVIAVGRSLDSLKETEQKVRNAGGAISCEALDLANFTAIQSLAASVDKRFGKLDVLVGNAARQPADAKSNRSRGLAIGHRGEPHRERAVDQVF